VSALPNRDRKAERREATRREIVDAAWDIAHEEGLENITLRAVAERVGMRSPSLYTHFESKNAIYDAMFGQAWADYLGIVEVERASIPAEPRAALFAMLKSFADYCSADLARFQVMNQRVLHDFTPSEASYAPSVRVYELFVADLKDIGVTDPEDVDLIASTIAGLIDSRFSNDPAGTRYIRQLPRVVDMLADEFGLPGPRLGGTA
jgi:AcrR family transcriptional regulator